MHVFPREVPFREIFRRFWPYVARRRRWFALGLLISLIPPAIETAEIWMFKILVDDVLIPRQFGLFPTVAGVYVALTLLGCAVSGASRMLSTWLSQRFLIELRTDLLRHLQTLSPTFFHRNRLGDLLTRMSGDVATIETFVLSALSSSLKASLHGHPLCRSSLLPPVEVGDRGTDRDSLLLVHSASVLQANQGPVSGEAAFVWSNRKCRRADLE